MAQSRARQRSRTTPAHRARRRPPFFHPVPLRTRRDGWTIERQCAFLAQLYVTGSVSLAACRVGMSRTSAYRLRERKGAEEFAWAWDRVLTPPGPEEAGRRGGRPQPDWRKVTMDALIRRYETGRVQPLLYRGSMTAIRRKPDDSALFRALRRFDAEERRAASRGAQPHG